MSTREIELRLLRKKLSVLQDQPDQEESLVKMANIQKNFL